jgi:hypothetical protein
MKNYLVSLKNVKQSAKNLSQFLKEQQVEISHSTLLHGLAKVFFFKNWNALEASFDAPVSLEPQAECEEKLICLKTNHSRNSIVSLFEKMAKKANCDLEIIKYNVTEKQDEIQVRVNLVKGMSNYSVFIFLIAQEMKAQNWQLDVFHTWRLDCKKENILPSMPLIKPRRP